MFPVGNACGDNGRLRPKPFPQCRFRRIAISHEIEVDRKYQTCMYLSELELIRNVLLQIARGGMSSSQAGRQQEKQKKHLIQTSKS